MAAEPKLAPFNVMMTPAAAAPLTVPVMLYVGAVVALAAKLSAPREALFTRFARLEGVKRYPVAIGASV